MFNAMVLALMFGLQLVGAEAAKVQAPTLELVLAKDHLPGSFLTSKTVYADREFIFLASDEGTLFVLENSEPDFPLVAEIAVSARPLRSVRGDRAALYVTSDDGKLYMYEKKKPFRFVSAQSISPLGLQSLAVDLSPRGTITVSENQTEMAADSSHVYLSALNQSEYAVSVSKKTDAVLRTFGEPFEFGVTAVFDRSTGDRIGSIANPPDVLGRVDQVALYANGIILAQTTPGCCGTGVFLYDTNLQPKASIPLPNANAVAVMNDGKWLVVGTEAGTVALFDISTSAPVMLAAINLRQVTGHTGVEDIEIRSVWADSKSGLVYAGSSWGNAVSRSLILPSFFVVRVK